MSAEFTDEYIRQQLERIAANDMPFYMVIDNYCDALSEIERLQSHISALEAALKEAVETVRDADLSQGGFDWILAPAMMPKYSVDEYWKKRRHWLEVLKVSEGENGNV